MLIAIDASSANKEKKTGVEWYAFRLIQALKELPLPEGVSVELWSPTPLTDELALMPERWNSRVLTSPIPRGWMVLRVSLACLTRKPDVLFVPAQGLPIVAGNTRLVTTVHDVEFRRVPQVFSSAVRSRLEKATRAAVKKANAILTISATTRDALQSLYHADVSRITVTYLAPSSEAYRVRGALRRPYFLYVGRIETRKNLVTLIRAFEQFKRGRGIGDPYELWLVGSDGEGAAAVHAYAKATTVSNMIRFAGYIPEDDLPGVMSHAAALTFPSLAEGFGMPIVEAFASGTPVLASDIPAHREIGADAAMLLPVDVPSAWADAMSSLASHTDTHRLLSDRGLERSKQFSWNVTAQQTMDVLLG